MIKQTKDHEKNNHSSRCSGLVTASIMQESAVGRAESRWVRGFLCGDGGKLQLHGDSCPESEQKSRAVRGIGSGVGPVQLCGCPSPRLGSSRSYTPSLGRGEAGPCSCLFPCSPISQGLHPYGPTIAPAPGGLAPLGWASPPASALPRSRLAPA